MELTRESVIGSEAPLKTYRLILNERQKSLRRSAARLSGSAMVTTAFSFSLCIVNAIAICVTSQYAGFLQRDSVDKNYGTTCILYFENEGPVAAFYYLSIKRRYFLSR